MAKLKHPKLTIKQILTSKNHWWNFYERNKNRIRDGILVAIVKLLSCRTIVRGYHEYACSNSKCSHTKKVTHTCKSKACSSCGKKATETWLQKQKNVLPKTTWQHITFTMPCELWDFFWYNRALLNNISKIAANCILSCVNKKNVIPGIFTALHTFGRDLKRNIHMHVSVSGGLFKDGTRWIKLYFVQSSLMKAWRYQIITLFRNAYKSNQLVIPPNIQKKLNHTFTFNHFLNALYEKRWIVHCAKPSKDHKKNIAYCARYVKRPAIAESKLRHYDGHEVKFKYLDHTTNTFREYIVTPEEFIAKFIQHIPDVGFRMIRYYGFLANRVRGNLLPKVYELLKQQEPQPTKMPTYAQLIQANFNFDPLKCILCGAQLALIGVHFGKSKINQLLAIHRDLAMLKNV